MRYPLKNINNIILFTEFYEHNTKHIMLFQENSYLILTLLDKC